MNERIQKLLPKSKKVRVITNAGMGYDTKEYFTQEQLEKFAELIVEECSKINNQFIGHRIGEIDLNIVYKQHFGFEK